MNTKQEALTIAELAIDISAVRPDRPVHCMVGAGSVSVTVFKADGEIDWQQNIFDWCHDEAFLPRLRFVRNELETMYQEALGERREVAA